jgi:ABC-type spermidine/putrescine transport system permease subunit II
MTASRAFARAATLITLGFLYAPVAVVILFSFQGSRQLSLPFTGPSTQWYMSLSRDEAFRQSLVASFRVAVPVSLAATTIGTLAALSFARYPGRWQRVLATVMVAPIALPGLFIGVALLTYFGRLGVQTSLLTVSLAHLIYALPYVVLVLGSRLERFDVRIEEAARTLGASGWETFWKVTFPITWPAIAAGGVLAFALSFDEFLITLFVVGRKATLPVTVWSRLRLRIDPSINAIATTLLTVFFLSGAIMAILLRVRRTGTTAVADE